MGKIMVTGASGFLGKYLTRRLLLKDYDVVQITSKHGDIAGGNPLKNIDTSYISHVFHLAAKTFVPNSWENPESFYHVNVNGTKNVLEICRKNNISMTLVSAYLYGRTEKFPISESDAIVPNNPYAHSKYLAEQLCEFYAKEFGVKVTIIRPFNIFGYGQDENFLIPHVIKQAMNHAFIRVKDLYPKRDYIYVEDVVDALLLTLNPKNCFSVYNIGSGYSVSVRQIIDLIQENIGTKKEIVAENIVRPNEISNVIADISKANCELNWFPRHSFVSGLVETIRLYKEDIHNERT